MSIGVIALIVVALFLLAYYFYGRFLRRVFALDNGRITPACLINDGADYVPLRPALLLPQHFSAISAAGPIVGPILAGLWFGWLPALLWIVLGNIFMGAAHDFSTLVASVRHRAQSVAEIRCRHRPALNLRYDVVAVVEIFRRDAVHRLTHPPA